ncbi:hypothetical protein [Actinomadura pelletieri]|uniref:hypothetical protein n=1 Tax=Actinomadura pelletieri TaxID=111805 RepID=UPI001476ADCE|nr:hypothetical protein [Actinomadura pelletieri]
MREAAEASDATIALDSITIAVLKAYREQQRRAAGEWGCHRSGRTTCGMARRPCI